MILLTDLRVRDSVTLVCSYYLSRILLHLGFAAVDSPPTAVSASRSSRDVQLVWAQIFTCLPILHWRELVSCWT